MLSEKCTMKKNDKKSTILPGLVFSYIQENYNKQISLKTMANSLGYNYTYLSAFFKKNLNMGFCEYINYYRIDNAKRLLLNFSYPITEISYMVGYNTIRSFNRAFLNQVGISPSEYRDLLKKNGGSVSSSSSDHMIPSIENNLHS